jgi:hypothetical protein
MIEHIARMLYGAGARDEALATLKPARRFVPSQPTLLPVGRAWRLGVLLLARDGTLYATGHVTRAIEPKDFNSDKTVAGEQRRAEQRAAARGPFARGEAVNYGFEVLDLAEPAHPLAVEDGQIVVLGQYAPVPLEKYLADHAALLIEATR